MDFQIIGTVLRQSLLIRKKLVNQLDQLRLFVVQPLFCNENLEAGEVGRTGRCPCQTNHAELHVLKNRMLSVAAGLRHRRGGYIFSTVVPPISPPGLELPSPWADAGGNTPSA